MIGSMSAPSLFTALKKGPLKVFIVGAGNWGTAVALLASRNAKQSYLFQDEVRIWVREEEVGGRKLTEIINNDHVNVKYLPGIPLPHNLVAIPNLLPDIKEADLILFVMPHQFIVSTIRRLSGEVKPTARALSLVKGMHVTTDGRPLLFSDIITDKLGIPCSVLMGANVAKDIARGQFSESTIGFQEKEKETAAVWQQLLDTPSFRINGIPDVKGVEVCGALKNVIALAAGFVDGMGLGSNTKAAIIRLGFEEMKLFAMMFFDGILEETFFESAGLADVITTCYGGRNVRCAAEFARRGGKSSWAEIENDLLQGQKMQGHLTCQEVEEVLQHHADIRRLFPLFSAAYAVAFGGMPPNAIIAAYQNSEPRPLREVAECAPVRVPEYLAAAKVLLTKESEMPLESDSSMSTQ